jgi:2Fe-2S ferredoxin
VRATSRLGCQSKVADEDVAVEITRESRQAWFDEHPEERAKLKQDGGSAAR